MIWVEFVAVAAVIIIAGVQLARYGDVLGEKSGWGRSWVGVVVLAATTSLPELFAGIGATAFSPLPNIALGDVFGSCMFNLLILSMMDAIQPEPITAHAHQGHALSIGFGLLLIGVAGLGLTAGSRLPPIGWVGVYTPVLIVVYFIAMRVIFTHEQHRRAREVQEVAEELQYAETSLQSAVWKYSVAALVVVAAALWLPRLGAGVARVTGLGQAFVGSLFIAITTSLPEIVVSLAAVRIGAVDLAIGNVLGSNIFNLLILGLDDLFYRQGPLMAHAAAAHTVSVVAIVMMNALFLIGLTYKVMTKRFVVAWDTGTIAAVWAVAVVLTYLLRA
jgi:cation:H+ antiporter